MSQESPEQPPRYFSRRTFREVWRERDEARQSLKAYEDVGPYLGLAQQLQDRVAARLDNGETAAMALQLATDEMQTEIEEGAKRTLIDKYKRDKVAELTETRQQEMLAEFVLSDQARIDTEVAAEITAQEPRLRQQAAQKAENELRVLSRDKILERIGTEEAATVLARLGDTALAAGRREALLAVLKEQALSTGMIDVTSLPADTLLVAGLKEPVAMQNGRRAAQSIQSCDRVLTLRVLDPAQGVLRIEEDSWKSSTDSLRKGSAFPDMTLARLPVDPERYLRPQIAIDTGLNLQPFDSKDPPFVMHGVETKVVSVFDQIVLQ